MRQPTKSSVTFDGPITYPGVPEDYQGTSANILGERLYDF